MKINQNIVFLKNIPYTEPDLFFEPYHEYYYSALLTGKGPEDISQYSYAALHPCLIIRIYPHRVELENHRESIIFTEKPLSFINSLYASLPKRDYPFDRCGFIGYMSYDAVNLFEDLSILSKLSYPCPLMELVLYRDYYIFENKTRKAYHIQADYEDFRPIIKRNIISSNSYTLSPFERNWDKNTYLRKIAKIKDYILKGHIYEINFTRQFKARFNGGPYQIFKKIFNKNPAPFSAFLNTKENTIICNSPEMFLKANDRKVETRPIKGTIPRGRNPIEESVNKEKLLKSEKDQAELYMIIDLLRNDISKSCIPGSVIVRESKRIERYSNLFHLIGIIRGKLRKDKTIIDLIEGAFPGGSITGCPKYRSMEIIDELELQRRGLYTGSIFLINRDFLISNIIIRTAIINNNFLYINSGGAITLDSSPEDEYNELMTKVDHFLKGL